MTKLFKNGALGIAACSAAVAMMASTSAMAADKVSGDLGVSYNSHFMSYGLDVWGGGDEFYGDRSTKFAWGGANFQVTDSFSLNVGAWADINDNAASSIGGDLQEVDVWFGAGYDIGKVSLSATYQLWTYAGDVEEVLDFGLGLDDSEYLGDFAMSPSLTWHIRTDGNGAQKTGSALVLGVSPGFDITDSVSLTIPAGIGFFLTDDFQGGTEGGYGYSYVGGSLGAPLSFIPSEYGEWSVNFDVIGYFTDNDAIPGNPEENFVTSSVGLSLAF